MNRRDFGRALFGFSAATLFRSVADSSDSEIDALYSRAMVMDSLCNIYAPGAPPTAALVDAARHSGITAINNTISDDTEDPFENLDELTESVASFSKCADDYSQALRYCPCKTRKKTWNHTRFPANCRIRKQPRNDPEVPQAGCAHYADHI